MDIKSPIMEKPPDISPAVKKIENEREEDVKNEKEKDELLETHTMGSGAGWTAMQRQKEWQCGRPCR